MVKHSEHEAKNSAHDSKKPSDGKADGDDAASSQADTTGSKLKRILSFVKRSLVPVIAIIALVVAAIAVLTNQADQAQLGEALTKIDNLTAGLAAEKVEIGKLKDSIAQEKSMQSEEHKKQDDQEATIIQNITQLQKKLKIFPTLEEQLLQSTVVAPVTQAPANTAPASAPATPSPSIDQDKKPASLLQTIEDAIGKMNKK